MDPFARRDHRELRPGAAARSGARLALPVGTESRADGEVAGENPVLEVELGVDAEKGMVVRLEQVPRSQTRRQAPRQDEKTGALGLDHLL